jgi:hypothetical protein
VGGVATYFLAQLVPDLLRRESVNVGVFVQKNGKVAARFVGERVPGGDLDGRKIRHLPHPDVYEQWVAYWRRVMRTSRDVMAELVRTNGGNFHVIAAGEVGHTGEDLPEVIVNYLYPLLVSDGGLVEALGQMGASADVANLDLRNSVESYFEAENILETAGQLFVPHPVRKNAIVQGETAPHLPAYTQDSGILAVMETVDFATIQKARAKDHAGWTAFMFSDIKARYRQDGAKLVKPVAIVRIRFGDEDDPTVRYSMSMLEKTSEQIVNWQIEKEREAFVRDCAEVARGKRP